MPVHMAQGKIPERMFDAPHRIQDVHRALHDVGQMPPAGRAHLVRLAVDVDAFAAEIEGDRAADHAHRRPNGTSQRLDQRGLSAGGFTGEAVDFVPSHHQADVVDGADLALHAVMLVDVIGLEPVDGQRVLYRSGFRHRRDLPCRRLLHCQAPIRASRLRGSIYSLIDIASMNRPRNSVTTKIIGNAIHHQIPDTMAEWALAQ